METSYILHKLLPKNVSLSIPLGILVKISPTISTANPTRKKKKGGGGGRNFAARSKQAWREPPFVEKSSHIKILIHKSPKNILPSKKTWFTGPFFLPPRPSKSRHVTCDCILQPIPQRADVPLEILMNKRRKHKVLKETEFGYRWNESFPVLSFHACPLLLSFPPWCQPFHDAPSFWVLSFETWLGWSISITGGLFLSIWSSKSNVGVGGSDSGILHATERRENRIGLDEVK